MWNAITQTKNHHHNFHSFMIKIIRKHWVFIKATPRYGLGDNSGAGSQSGGPDDDGYGGGHGYGDGKGRDDKAGRKGKGDGKDSYGWPDGKQAPWYNPGSKGGKRPSKWAAEYDVDMKQAQKEKDNEDETTKTTETRKGTFAGQLDARAYPAGKAPADWFVGQMTPNTYAINGVVDSWRKVKEGEKCQWSDRIARCTKEEHQMNQK
jgi:hypothetical protein